MQLNIRLSRFDSKSQSTSYVRLPQHRSVSRNSHDEHSFSKVAELLLACFAGGDVMMSFFAYWLKVAELMLACFAGGDVMMRASSLIGIK